MDFLLLYPKRVTWDLIISGERKFKNSGLPKNKPKLHWEPLPGNIPKDN